MNLNLESWKHFLYIKFLSYLSFIAYVRSLLLLVSATLLYQNYICISAIKYEGKFDLHMHCIINKATKYFAFIAYHIFLSWVKIINSKFTRNDFWKKMSYAIAVVFIITVIFDRQAFHKVWVPARPQGWSTIYTHRSKFNVTKKVGFWTTEYHVLRLVFNNYWS